MNAVLIWSALPITAALLISLLRRERAVFPLGVAVALLLAWAALELPIGEPIPLRLWRGMPALRIEPELNAFGSRFALGNAARPALALLYLSVGFWIGGAGAARARLLFPSMSLAAAGLLSVALAAEGIPPQVLLIALAALVCIPIVSPPGEPAKRGALRFMVFSLGGACLILFADASLASTLAAAALPGAETDPGDLASTVLMLALGFALFLAVVPFHSWMPMLGEEADPYAAAFIFFVLPLAVAFLAFDALQQYSVSGLTPAMFSVLRNAGALMAISGGVGAAFERHMGRTLGFAGVASLGMTLMAISLNDQLGRATPAAGIFFGQLVPQGLMLAVWGLALKVLRERFGSLDHPTLRGAARVLPAAAAAAVFANLSAAGTPLLAGFPAHLALWTAAAAKSQAWTLVSLMGMAGLAVGALRSLAVLAATGEEPQPSRPDETRLQQVLLVLGIVALFLVGLFPQAYLPTLTEMAMIFAGGAP